MQISDIQGCHWVIWWPWIHLEYLFAAILRRHQTRYEVKEQLHFLFTMTIAFLRPRCTLTYTNLKSSDSRLFFSYFTIFLYFVNFMIFFLFYKNISRNPEDCVTLFQGTHNLAWTHLAHQRKRWRLTKNKMAGRSVTAGHVSANILKQKSRENKKYNPGNKACSRRLDLSS